MTIEEYKPYIKQRAMVIALAKGLTPEQIKSRTFTLTTDDGKQYKVEPLAGETAAAYKKRFIQLDKAVKAMLNQIGCTTPIEVTMRTTDGGSIVLNIDPTPDQQEEAEYRELRKMLRYLEDTEGVGIWAERGLERPPIGKPSKAAMKPRKQGKGSTAGRATTPRMSGSRTTAASRTSRPTPAPKVGQR